MELIHGNEENFEELINKDLVLVDFYAEWCGPCKMLGPVLEEIDSVLVVKMDVDNCPNLTKRYGILSVPTMMLFKSGNLVATQNGFMPKEEIENWIEMNK